MESILKCVGSEERKGPKLTSLAPLFSGALASPSQGLTAAGPSPAAPWSQMAQLPFLPPCPIPKDLGLRDGVTAGAKGH